MNEIIEKLKIPGFETKVFVVPRKNKSTKVEKAADGIQLSLDIEIEQKRHVQESSV